MNSKTEKKKKPDELLNHIASMEAALAKMAANINQLQRIIWLVVKASGGKVKIDEADLPTLWKLDRMRSENEGKKHLVLEATETQPPTSEQVNALVSKIQGTSITIAEAQKELGLEEYPANFLEFYISDRLVWVADKWLHSEIARQAARAEGQN